MAKEKYSVDFFKFISSGKDSYKNLLAPVMDALQPKSIIDLGTGSGTWLAAAKELGASRVLGLDGSWASAEHRHISDQEFQVVDFEDSLPDVGRFDLAICLEVLEHISSDAGSRAIAWLCERSDVILFSAAIPGQEGTHHIHEAWQSYWAGKFKEAGYQPYDVIRPIIWSNLEIPWWYKQNTIIYALPDAVKSCGWSQSDIETLDLVHPQRFEMAIEMIAKLRRRTLKGRIRSLFGLKS